MSKFTASNGISVDIDDAGVWVEDKHTLSLDEEQAAREFFQHERDEELGRWRWPENPDYVVYPKVELQERGNTRGVTVLTERVPRTYTVWEDNVAILYGTSSDEVARQGARGAARAYFEAHPERKPWEDAEVGDLWVLTKAGRGTDVWRRGKHEWLIVTPGTTGSVSPASALEADSGHRIWPELD